MPSTTIRYPSGTFGYDKASPQGGGSVTETFVAGGTILAGSGVDIDTTAGTVGQVVQAGAASTSAFVGIAVDGAAAGEVVQVVMFGHALARVNTVLALGAAIQTAASGFMAAGTATAGTTKAIVMGASADTNTKLIPVLVTRL